MTLASFRATNRLPSSLTPTTSGDTEYETYLPGDDVGDAYDATKWTDRTDAIVGRAGPTGPQSRIVLYAYINTATAPTVAPTGGTFVQSTGVKTVPTGYTAAPVIATDWSRDVPGRGHRQSRNGREHRQSRVVYSRRTSRLRRRNSGGGICG